MEFNNSEITFENLPDFEKVQLQPISRKFGWVVAFNWVIFSFIFLGALFIFNLVKPNFFGFDFTYFFLGAILFLVINYVISYFAFFKRKFATRTHDIIYQYGLIKSNTIIIPYNRIQHVNLEEGWLSRILEIRSISIFTAGQDNGDIKIHGLDIELSEKINQLILNKIKTETKKVENLNSQEIIEDES